MRRVIRGDIVETPFDHHGLLTLQVKETDPGATFRKLLVRAAPPESYVVCLDGLKFAAKKCSHPIKQFSLHFDPSVDRVNRVCDAIIVLPTAEELRISVLDLKSTAPRMADAKLQIQSSELFVRYVVEVVRWVTGEATPLAVSRRVVMTGPVKSFVGGARGRPKFDDNVGVIAVPVNAAGVGQLGFGMLFD